MTQTLGTNPTSNLSDVLFFDCEATTYEKGNPFSRSNRLMCVVTLFNGDYVYHDIEHSGLPYNGSLDALRQLFEKARLVVGFNLKYDLHWIRRYCPDINIRACFDAQLAEFLLSDQRVPYPSLDSCAAHYGIDGKLDVVAIEYWDQGIDTDKVPVEILKEYCQQDVRITKELYEHQIPRLKAKNQEALFQLQCDDLLVLAEMEHNGMAFNSAKARESCAVAEGQMRSIMEALRLASHDTGALVNWNSGHHLSAVLYGGYIEYFGVKEEGMRGRPILRQTFPQLVKPLPNTETVRTAGLSDADLVYTNEARRVQKKRPIQRIYFTNEDVLRALRCTGPAKKIVKLLLEYAELEKLVSTYFLGIPAIIEKFDWEPGIVHGRLNQCVAVTGRLSSAQPNLQNFASAVKFLFEHRNGCLLNVDVKALEWVAAVYLSQDPVGMQEILDKIDQHAENVAALGLNQVLDDPKEARLIAKIFLFRLIFGGTAYAFAHDPDFMGVSTSDKFWQGIIDRTYAKYKGLKKWHTKLIAEVVDKGFLLMPTKRRYYYQRKNGNWPISTILNYPVQGLGADLVAILRVSLYKRMRKAGLKSLLICTVHDSIMIDAYLEEVPQLIAILDGVFKDVGKNFLKLFGVEFNLPLRGEISQGSNWGNLEEISYAN